MRLFSFYSANLPSLGSKLIQRKLRNFKKNVRDKGTLRFLFVSKMFFQTKLFTFYFEQTKQQQQNVACVKKTIENVHRSVEYIWFDLEYTHAVGKSTSIQSHASALSFNEIGFFYSLILIEFWSLDSKTMLHLAIDFISFVIKWQKRRRKKTMSSKKT